MGVGVAALERVRRFLVDELGEDRMPLARPDLLVSFDGPHPVPIARVAHADLTDGIRT
jgi:hypothetical protein